MSSRTGRVLAGLLGALVLAVGATSAAASRSIEASPAEGELGDIRKHALALSFNDGFREEIICEVILRLRHNASIAKTAGATMGTIFDGGVTNCRGGTVTIPGERGEATISWRKTYEAFTGTLPNIGTIITKVSGVTFLVASITSGCQYRGEVRFITGGTAMRELTLETGATIPFERRLFGMFCEMALRIRGALEASPRVNYRLV